MFVVGKNPTEYTVKSRANLYEDYNENPPVDPKLTDGKHDPVSLHQPAPPEEVVAVDSDEELGKKKKDKYAFLWKMLKLPIFTPCLMLAQTVLMIIMIVEGVQRGEFGDFWKSKKI